LCQIGKISQDARIVLNTLFDAGINIEQITPKHLPELTSLPLNNEHRDPNDRMIIAQAISDHVPLISSDNKFSLYKRYGLNSIFNER
jgi:PIN domain nuclease of toxin-antitoxin system